MSSTDVESLEPTVRHRNKCVYASLACLAFAVVVASLGGAAVFIVVWGELQTQIELLNKQIDLLNSTQNTYHHNSPLRTSLTGEGMFKVSCLSKQALNCVVMQSFVSLCNGKTIKIKRTQI